MKANVLEMGTQLCGGRKGRRVIRLLAAAKLVTLRLLGTNISPSFADVHLQWGPLVTVSCFLLQTPL